MRHKFIRKTYKESQCSTCGLVRFMTPKTTHYILENIYLVIMPPCQRIEQGNLFYGYREDVILPESKKVPGKEKQSLYEPGTIGENDETNSERGYDSIEAIIEDCRRIFDVREVIWNIPST